MALIINATESKKLPITGTSFELQSIYTRINWNAQINGISVQYTLVPFETKSFYLNNEPCPIAFEGGSGFVQLAENQTQDLVTIHELVKAELEAKGFEVTIDLA
jgi:hypothetical protein